MNLSNETALVRVLLPKQPAPSETEATHKSFLELVGRALAQVSICDPHHLHHLSLEMEIEMEMSGPDGVLARIAWHVQHL